MSVNTKINGVLVKSAGLYKNIVPIGLGDCYSTEERQIGCWEDGKPLYQRVVKISTSVNISANTWTSLGISATDISKIITTQLFNDAPAYLIVSGAIQNNYISINSPRAFNIVTSERNWWVLLQYTKTTDVAGSGIYVPSGAYAVHYSAEEQVIGTWTDGKPIYRKVLPTQSFGNTDVAYNHNIGIHMYLRYYGSCTINNNLIPRAFPCYQHRYNQYCEIGGYNANQITFSSNWSGNTATAILEYTKESDYT